MVSSHITGCHTAAARFLGEHLPLSAAVIKITFSRTPHWIKSLKMASIKIIGTPYYTHHMAYFHGGRPPEGDEIFYSPNQHAHIRILEEITRFQNPGIILKAPEITFRVKFIVFSTNTGSQIIFNRRFSRKQ